MWCVRLSEVFLLPLEERLNQFLLLQYVTGAVQLEHRAVFLCFALLNSCAESRDSKGK